MNPDHNLKDVRIKKITVLLAVLVVAAGVVGWLLGRSSDSLPNTANNSQLSNPKQPDNDNKANTRDVRSLANYRLPFNWGEASCPSESGSVFVVPSGGNEVDCTVNPNSPIISPVKISADSSSSKDCNRLQNVQNVSKHVCVSEYINGRKSLKAETVYNRSSFYRRDTTVNAYYIDTGKGVIKLEYFHSPNDHEYQKGFEQLAKSVQTAQLVE